ncbi:hypothetical protein NZD88_10180 [Chryseobacterium antibioticum]|uniref:Uncharacterized protein n=1 Tax=Chryseobacterium pyrolae TaxID=2987481 RepID=A0ABT2IH00_9FLAO|nr:hypothetical protein [Chryseobacterium pyrolae]MCT2407906.1 hypothetical protein [Chryseobacterium pyrolae]
MIEFKTEVKELLPYDRKQYIALKKWYGVSFQLPGVFEGKDIGLIVFLENYVDWFKNIILNLDSSSPWIVNHDDKDLKWLPNNDDTLSSLRTLFKQNNIPSAFTGALVFMKDDLLKYSKDLISYPYGVYEKKESRYKDLDISHSQLQFVIKISGHLSIDLLSTDKELLKKIVNSNSSGNFNII